MRKIVVVMRFLNKLSKEKKILITKSFSFLKLSSIYTYDSHGNLRFFTRLQLEKATSISDASVQRARTLRHKIK